MRHNGCWPVSVPHLHIALGCHCDAVCRSRSSVIWLSVESRDPHMFMSPPKSLTKGTMCVAQHCENREFIASFQPAYYSLFYLWNKAFRNGRDGTITHHNSPAIKLMPAPGDSGSGV